MGSSRASTPAGKRRTTQRASARSATAHPRTKARPAARPAKRAPKKAPPRTKGRAATPPRRPKAKTKTKTGGAARPARSARSDRGLLRRAIEPINVLTAAVILLCLAGTYWFWFRDSSFVQVERATVTGVDGPGSAEIERVLTEAAGTMTTLHVREDVLADAVAGFPTVISVSADADFPDALAIRVQDRPPAMLASADGREVPVAGDGTLLEGVDVEGAALPAVDVAQLPRSGTLQGDDLELARVAGAAPEPLRPLIADLSVGGAEGIEVTLEGDIPVYFGTGDRAPEKWSAAAAVLADPKVQTMTYLDVRVPERPAVGGAAPGGATLEQ
jgi:cell division protein FtsQ